MPIDTTVLASWVLAIYRTIQSYGIDPDPLLRKAGIDKALFNQHQARISSAKTNDLWELAMEATKDLLIDIRVPEYMIANSVYAIDLAAQAMPTLRELMRFCCRFSRIVTTAVELRFVDGKKYCQLELVQVGDVPQIAPSVDAYVTVMSTIIKPVLLVINAPEPFFYDINVTRPRPNDVKSYEENLPCSVNYNCDKTFAVFNSKLLDVEIPGSNPEFTRLSEDMMVKYLSGIQNHDIEMNVRSVIMELMSEHNLNKVNVADRLNMSVRTLTGKLSEVNLTFSQLLDSIRQEKAISLIKQPNVSFGEISYQLGFLEANSFTRAFRKWTGLTPGQYREGMQSGSST